MKGATTITRTLGRLYRAEKEARAAFYAAEIGDQAAITAYRNAEHAASTARWDLVQRFGEATVATVENDILASLFPKAA